MPDPLIAAAAVVGAVVLYQEFPAVLRPKVKPFSCPVCMSFWLGLGVSLALLDWTVPFLAVLGCVILDGCQPWLFSPPEKR